ncbi:MAG: TauD/TfdA family dioxygenase [Magnetococcales bacterium]|nr:TauD/TfdA family dioxygenase [Magnetococcales bacterium]
MANSSIFNLGDDRAYNEWREAKLAGYPQSLADLVVEINSPYELTADERTALLKVCAKANMVVFAVKNPDIIKDNPLPALLKQLGVEDVDCNLGAGESGLSKLSPGGSAYGPFANYIPYRQAEIGWHTDGYYNTNERQVLSLALYCHRSAHEGGDNQLLDHEIAYIKLRDENPEFIKTFMDQEVMTIPARMDGDKVARPDRTGPVFSVKNGFLHMRYTARTISISWKDSQKVVAAVDALTRIMNGTSPFIIRGRLENGLGLISNNILHTRGAFIDLEDGPKRELYRLRCFDRVATE